MHLPSFTHLSPESRAEAARLLAAHGPEAALVSGGTDLFPRMKYRLLTPRVLVSLSGITPTMPVLGEDGVLALDALTTLSRIARSPIVRKAAPLLAEAALTVASGQVRNAATLGGNLCLECRCLYYNQSHEFQFVEPCIKRGGGICYFAPKGNKCWAVFAADTVPALLVLDASLQVVDGAGRQRVLKLGELYTGDAKNPLNLGPAEILEKVLIPAVSKNERHAFRKFSRRKGIEFAGLTVAAALMVGEDAKTCLGARIAVGSVAGGPIRAKNAEEELLGKDLSDLGTLRAAGAAVAGEIRPFAHHGYPASHLRHCLEVEAGRALNDAMGIDPQGIS